MLHPTQIPDQLKARNHWIAWKTEDRNGTPTKVPINPVNETYASVSNPETWATYPATRTQYNLNDDLDGIGYVFSEDCPFTGIDLDDCRDPETGQPDQWAVDVITQLDSYTEQSPSHTGYHIIVKATVPDGGNRNEQLEMYDSGRFFTVTGAHIPGTPKTIEERQDTLQDIHTEYITDKDTGNQQPAAPTARKITISDQELIEKALNAANGEKFRRLWIGDTSGYQSHSEADQALCNYLAFWTGGDKRRMERLFSKSGLTREKWYAREDYRERTIETAVRDCNEFYEPGDPTA